MILLGRLIHRVLVGSFVDRLLDECPNANRVFPMVGAKEPGHRTEIQGTLVSHSVPLVDLTLMLAQTTTASWAA
jgi:hypothetical protein